MSNVNDFEIIDGVLIEYHGKAADVAVPEGVRKIGNCAFFDCSSLTSITIPEGVTSIGDNAFNWCNSLTSITIPEGLTKIGKGAFSDCKSLTNIRIPEGVTEIGDSAFHCCYSLKDHSISSQPAKLNVLSFMDIQFRSLCLFIKCLGEVSLN